MSYRSLKRVFGETSLERKCRFLFGGCLLLLITGSFWWYGTQTEELVNEAEPRARAAAWSTRSSCMQHWTLSSNAKTTRSRATICRSSFERPEQRVWPAANHRWEFIRPVDRRARQHRPSDEFEWRRRQADSCNRTSADGKSDDAECRRTATSEFASVATIVTTSPSTSTTRRSATTRSPVASSATKA